MKLKLAASIGAIAVATVLSGCGIAEGLGRGCSGDTKELCQDVFGGKNYEDQEINNRQQQDDIDNLAARTAALEVSMASSIAQLNSQQAALVLLQSQVAASAADIAAAQSAIAVLQSSVTAQGIAISNMQGENPVVQIVDPCGTQPGYNEVVMRLRNGDLVSFFQMNGTGNLFLVNLPIGSYATGDQTGCQFSVNSAKQVCDSTGCH